MRKIETIDTTVKDKDYKKNNEEDILNIIHIWQDYFKQKYKLEQKGKFPKIFKDANPEQAYIAALARFVIIKKIAVAKQLVKYNLIRRYFLTKKILKAQTYSIQNNVVTPTNALIVTEFPGNSYDVLEINIGRRTKPKQELHEFKTEYEACDKLSKIIMRDKYK